VCVNFSRDAHGHECRRPGGPGPGGCRHRTSGHLCALHNGSGTCADPNVSTSGECNGLARYPAAAPTSPAARGAQRRTLKSDLSRGCMACFRPLPRSVKDDPLLGNMRGRKISCATSHDLHWASPLGSRFPQRFGTSLILSNRHQRMAQAERRAQGLGGTGIAKHEKSVMRSIDYGTVWQQRSLRQSLPFGPMAARQFTPAPRNAPDNY
jgi:hypothetical protein